MILVKANLCRIFSLSFARYGLSPDLYYSLALSVRPENKTSYPEKKKILERIENSHVKNYSNQQDDVGSSCYSL